MTSLTIPLTSILIETPNTTMTIHFTVDIFMNFINHPPRYRIQLKLPGYNFGNFDGAPTFPTKELSPDRTPKGYVFLSFGQEVSAIEYLRLRCKESTPPMLQMARSNSPECKLQVVQPIHQPQTTMFYFSFLYQSTFR